MTAFSSNPTKDFEQRSAAGANGATADAADALAADEPSQGGGLRFWLVLFAALLVFGLPILVLTRGTGLKTAVLRKVLPNHPAAAIHPYVTLSRPNGGDGSVPPDSFIAADIQLPNTGGIIDPATLNAGSVRLVRRGDGGIVPARVNTSAAGDALVLQPDAPLEPNTHYRFEVLPALKDTRGSSFRPFSAGFTTSANVPASTFPAAFEKLPLEASNGHGYTGLTVGPDGRLYACTYEGLILRFTLRPDGFPIGVETFDAVRRANGGPRLITGICFDPAATADDPVLWVNHGQFVHGVADEWTGKLARLSGSTLSEYTDVLVGLPRATRDHLNNQIAFGPDGALYLAQGSNTAMGAPDVAWGFRPERKLTAAILRLDVAKLDESHLPLDVKTDDAGHYDPAAPGAPLTIYAAGLRNPFDLVWHRNGRLYAPVNGSAAGGNVPVAPAPATGPATAPATHPALIAPGLTNVRITLPDLLERVEPGAYHGHPNPTRGQFVLMGGNPTGGADPFEVIAYPVGTPPQKGWVKPALHFGQNLSPCGLIEYRALPNDPCAALDGKLLVCRYSGGKDLVAVTLADDGSVTELMTGLDGMTHFQDPLDVTQHPQTGFLYVAEFGGHRISLVRPGAARESLRVYRQIIQNGVSVATTSTPATQPSH